MKTLVFVALVVLLAVVGYIGWLGVTGTPATLPFLGVSGDTAEIMDATKLGITDVVVGTGAEAVNGKEVTVEYTGTLVDGTKFDSSKDHGKPFSFTLGVGQVIKGWDEGVLGMKVGGKRTLVIPSALAYGVTGIPGAIPANATLNFEVELLGVK